MQNKGYKMFSITKNETPCFKCNKRTAECHSTCYNYKEWVKEFEKSKEKIKNAKNKENLADSYEKLRSKRAQNTKRRRIARNGDM